MVAWNSANIFNKPQTVLIASKNQETLRVWSEFFKQKDYLVISESETKNCLKTSHLIKPALIILDLDLTQAERISLCRQLRATSDGALLLLAPRIHDMEIFEYYQAGVDEFIATPVNPMAVVMKSITWLTRQEWFVPRKEDVQVYT